MRIISPVTDAPTSDSHRNERSSTSVNPESGTNVGSPPTSVAKPSSVATKISTIPTVILETDVVSDNMAAGLCISFLGHVMFLKNQVPFPIVQLARMPTGDVSDRISELVVSQIDLNPSKDTTRAAKKRHELLNSFDTLASHLYTTFIALSTALALRGSPEKLGGTEASPDNSADRKNGSDRTFFAVALGPTLGAAKTRVIVGINGLETKVWGLRADKLSGARRQHRESEESSTRDDEENSQSSDDADDPDQESEDEDDCDSEEVSEPGSDDGDASPPPSRSPSPSSSSDSEGSSLSDDLRVEDPGALRAAERLLSRTLATACAEDDGHGLASEMAPTQIHVLLRAPRRFVHPAWTPRQNLCVSWDSYLAEFLQESGDTPISNDLSSRKRTKASKVQGIWVRCRGSDNEPKIIEEALAEADELIWWSWDGKLVGFADW